MSLQSSMKIIQQHLCVSVQLWSQGYIGYDLREQHSRRAFRPRDFPHSQYHSYQCCCGSYDEAFYTPTKVLGRYLNAEEANLERKKGNYIVEEPGKGFRRIVSAPNPVSIVEIDAIKALLDADQVVIACGGGEFGTVAGQSSQRSQRCD